MIDVVAKTKYSGYAYRLPYIMVTADRPLPGCNVDAYDMGDTLDQAMASLADRFGLPLSAFKVREV